MPLDHQKLDDAVAQWAQTGRRFEVEGIMLTQADIDALIASHEHLSWVDFTGAIFWDAGAMFMGANFGDGGVSFMRVKFTGGGVDFANAQLGRGGVRFTDARFANGEVRFTNTRFADGEVDFSGARFGRGDLTFEGASFGSGSVNFADVQFGDGDVNFNNADFGDGDVSFTGARFSDGHVDFKGSRFGSGDVAFNEARFGQGELCFNDVRFGTGKVDFSDANLGDGRVSFNDTRFGNGDVLCHAADFGNGNVNFWRAQFGDGRVDFRAASLGTGNVNFSEARFGDGSVDFSGASFGKGNVNFNDTEFGSGDTIFSGASFDKGNVNFWRADFGQGRLDFSGTSFGKGNVNFGDASFGNGSVDFSGADLGAPLEIGTANLDVRGADLRHGGLIAIGESINLTGTRISQPTTISRSPSDHAVAIATPDTATDDTHREEESGWRNDSGTSTVVQALADDPARTCEAASKHGRARITSMDQAWITAPLTIGAGVSLADCTFDGTSGLDFLRPEGRAFAVGESGMQRLPGDRPLLRISSKHWRQQYRVLVEWRERQNTDRLAARASRYRQIRVGLESAGNIPGANDFYVGELDNRRLAARWRSRPLERLMLQAYWVANGYGQRAWRAMSWFAVVVIAGAVALRGASGSAPRRNPPGTTEALVTSLRAATSFFAPPDAAGYPVRTQLVLFAVRFTGPILLGLAFFAIRNRVKR